jgi:ribosomal protein L20A (L18A)
VKNMDFVATGIFMKNGEENKFTKNLTATSEKAAKEKIYAEFGSKNNLKRKDIKIKEIKGAN